MSYKILTITKPYFMVISASHQKEKIHGTNEGDKCKSSSTSSTLHSNLDLLHLPKEDFSLKNIYLSNSRKIELEYFLVKTLDSRYQYVLHTKNQSNEMASTVNNSKVKCVVSEIHFEYLMKIVLNTTSSHITFQKRPFMLKKNEKMVSNSSPDKVGSKFLEDVFSTRRIMNGTHKEYESFGQQNMQLLDGPLIETIHAYTTFLCAKVIQITCYACKNMIKYNY